VPVLQLTEDTFDSEVLGAETPVLVDFWADWCGPCRQIAPVIESLAEAYGGQVKIAKLDVDSAEDIAVRYDIRSIPMLLMFQNGQVTAQIIGAVPRSKIEGVIKDALANGHATRDQSR
jgi:thioredoxin 1